MTLHYYHNGITLSLVSFIHVIRMTGQFKVVLKGMLNIICDTFLIHIYKLYFKVMIQYYKISNGNVARNLTIRSMYSLRFNLKQLWRKPQGRLCAMSAILFLNNVSCEEIPWRIKNKFHKFLPILYDLQNNNIWPFRVTIKWL